MADSKKNHRSIFIDVSPTTEMAICELNQIKNLGLLLGTVCYVETTLLPQQTFLLIF